MPRQTSPLEINKFTGGLITDASPLTSPNGYMIDGENFLLNFDGSVQRRLGLDLEVDYSPVITSISTTVDTAVTSFRWNNAGGVPEQAILTVQVGNELKFFNLSSVPISAGFISTYKDSSWPTDTPFSFTVVDGILVIATGQQAPISFTYASGAITSTTFTLKIRDLFGVADSVSGTDLYAGSGLQVRPTTQTDTHIYNLRNQSWGISRVDGNGTGATTPAASDPITAFRLKSSNAFPSNSDTVTECLYPDPNNTSNRTIDRFFAEDLFKNPIGTFKAANGYFIIDALNRGASRLSNMTTNQTLYGLSFSVSSLPTDSTPGGPTVVCEYAGRAWFAGFSGVTNSGDKLSPRMSSYLLFSQLVNNVNDISSCYQSGDPTSKDSPDVIDTDGGYIRINEAYGIKRLVNLGDSLFVIASNGVWRVFGGTVKGFTATSYIVEKVTERGVSNSDNVAVIENTLMYWSDDGIYHVKPDQYGTWSSINLAYGRVQTLIDSIGAAQRQYVKGAYDNFEQKVRWLYQNSINDTDETMELVYDTKLGAWFVNRIKQLASNFPRTVSIYTGNPYQLIIEPTEVLVGTNQVFITDLEDVQVGSETTVSQKKKELGYIVILNLNPIQYGFATYRDPTWHDFTSVDANGVDAYAFAVTNYLPGANQQGQPGDFQRNKQVPYITVHLKKTETGFQFDTNGDLVPVNASSCIIQSMWDWTNSAASGRWGRPFQAYRHKRLWMPIDVNDTYEDGYLTVVTKNKLRGRGKVVSIMFSTEESKDCHLYGWSMILSEAGYV